MAFRDEESLHLIMEFCPGGSLLRKIEHYWDEEDSILDSVASKGLPPRMVASYTWQLLSGLAYMHHHRFAHRDVKAENCMLAEKGDSAALKLIDFGLACSFERGVPMTERVGTPHCAAPEVLRGSYGEGCDVWSAGVVGYLACTGHRPFRGTREEVVALVEVGSVEYKAADWKTLPDALQRLVASMLEADPSVRPRAKQVIAESEWLRRHGRPGRGGACCCPVA